MTAKVIGIGKRVLTLVLIELLVPGGTLVVLALLFMGSSGFRRRGTSRLSVRS